MRKIHAVTIILILATQLAMAHLTLATHSATVAWIKPTPDAPSYPSPPGDPTEYYWNGAAPKWIWFQVVDNGPNTIKEIKLVFEKSADGNSMFNFSQTSQSKAGWYATPDEFGPNKRPTVLYFRTDNPSQFIGVRETVTFGLFITQGPGECRHNIDVWTVDAGSTPSTNFYVLWVVIDQTGPQKPQITVPQDGSILNKPNVRVEAKATDREGLHLSGIKNATLRIHYTTENSQFPDFVHIMSYDQSRDAYYLDLTDGNGLRNEGNHTCTVTVYDYAENGPKDSESITFFWFRPATTKPYPANTDLCFLHNTNVGHVGSNFNFTNLPRSGFRPSSEVTVTFRGQPVNPIPTNKWGGIIPDSFLFQVPPAPRGQYTLVFKDTSSPPVEVTSDPFTVIPWMENTGQRIRYVGEQATVNGSGFAASVNVNVIYRDVSLGNVYNSSADEWSDEATHFTWNPHLDNLPVGVATTDSSGSFSLTFNVPESYGGTHPVFGQEVRTGVRSGWMPSTVPEPSPDAAYPEAAFVKVMTKTWTEPTIGLSGQFIKIFATGLPLPEYHSTTYDCKTKLTTREDHDWALALDFGPNKYWVFEKGFILNNEFDLGWSLELYLPFAYWCNHEDPTSPTWKGNLYWKDFNGNYHTGSQFLKVPAILFGNYNISLYEFNRQTETDEKEYLATTEFTVLKDPLYVRASSGTLYFRGEKVTVYAEVDLDGVATDATDISFRLYYEDSFMMSLTAKPVSDAQGLYVASFTCPPQEGNYFVKVNASKVLGGSLSLSGFGVTSFVVSPTLNGLNATLTAINNGVATINTGVGTITFGLHELEGNVTAINGMVATITTSVGSIRADVSTIDGKVTSMDGNLATISTSMGIVKTDILNINGKLVSLTDNVATVQTDVGTLKTDISNINGKLVSLNGNVATVQTDVGTLKTTLDSIGATITATGADTVTIKTTVGDIQGKITSVDGRTADIQTNIGLISTSTDSIKTQTGLQPTGIALSLVGALAAIIAAVLIFRKLYK